MQIITWQCYPNHIDYSSNKREKGLKKWNYLLQL
jgi:hypothetical protein